MEKNKIRSMKMLFSCFLVCFLLGGSIFGAAPVALAEEGSYAIDLTTLEKTTYGFTSVDDNAAKIVGTISAMMDSKQIGFEKIDDPDFKETYSLDFDKDGSYDVLYLTGESSYGEMIFTTVIMIVLDTRSITNEYVLNLTSDSIKKAETAGKEYFSTLNFLFPAPHVHSWSSEWKMTSQVHYHDCNALLCPIIEEKNKAGYGKHTFGSWKITKEATASAKGTRKHSCTVCGYTVTEEYSLGDSDNTSKTDTVKKGKVFTDSKTKAKYKVTSVGAVNTVSYTASTNKNAVSISVLDSVKLNGITFKVTSIGAGALKSNKKLKKLTIGSSIKTIGKNAFLGCKKLSSVTIKTTQLTDKSVGANAFKGISVKAKIKVPAKKLTVYKKILKKKGVSGKKQKITK